ncbi:MAG: hypothetical protein AAGD92_02240 [Pseudomonadota bacterium]
MLILKPMIGRPRKAKQIESNEGYFGWADRYGVRPLFSASPEVRLRKPGRIKLFSVKEGRPA